MQEGAFFDRFTNMKDKIQHEVDRLLDYAEQLYSTKIPRPSLRFDLKGQTAGQSHYSKRYLRFNLTAATRYPEKYFKTTLPHEVCHYVASHLYPYKKPSHGTEWKMVSSALCGCIFDRCHTYDLPPARVTIKFSYQCPCKKVFKVGKVRHNRIMSNPRAYWCPSCRGFLTFLHRS